MSIRHMIELLVLLLQIVLFVMNFVRKAEKLHSVG